MRRKQLNGIAASMAQKFAASAEHFAYLAMLHDCRAVEINLLTLDVSPAVFNIERNRNLAGMCADNLLALVQRDELNEATLMARFDCETEGLPPRSIRSGMMEVRLVSRTGQEATGHSINAPQLVGK